MEYENPAFNGQLCENTTVDRLQEDSKESTDKEGKKYCLLKIYGLLLGVLALFNLGGGIWLYTQVDALGKTEEYLKLSSRNFTTPGNVLAEKLKQEILEREKMTILLNKLQQENIDKANEIAEMKVILQDQIRKEVNEMRANISELQTEVAISLEDSTERSTELQKSLTKVANSVQKLETSVNETKESVSETLQQNVATLKSDLQQITSRMDDVSANISKNIRRDIDLEREKREMSFNQLSDQIEQITQRLDHTDKNISENAYHIHQARVSIDSLRESHTANMTQVTVRLDQAMQRIDDSDANVSRNAYTCKRVETSMLNLTESTGAEIEALKDNMLTECHTWEISLNNITRALEALTTNSSRLATQMDQMDHRMDGIDKNISRIVDVTQRKITEEQNTRLQDLQRLENNLNETFYDTVGQLTMKIRDVETNSKNSIDQLRGEINTENSARVNLERNIMNQLNGERDARIREMAVLESNMTDQRETLTSLAANSAQLTSSVRENGSKLSKLFSIVFHAVVSERSPDMNTGEKVKFDNTKLNTGNGYSGQTGIFTVPVGSGGLYFLSAHLVVDDKKWAAFVIMKNTEILCGFYEENSSSPGEDGTGSCSATAHLNGGDELYVKVSSISSSRPVQCQSNWCGFTGFLMKPDS